MCPIWCSCNDFEYNDVFIQASFPIDIIFGHLLADYLPLKALRNCDQVENHLSDEIIAWFNKTGWFTIILFGVGVPVVLILMLMSPSLMTQKPKCYFSLVFLTLMLS